MDENQTGHAETADGAMMFLPIAQDGILLGYRHPDGILLCAASTPVMDRSRFRKKYHPPTSVPTTLAPIYIFGIHEKTFVEQPEFIDGFASGHPKTAYQNVHVQNAIAIEIEHMFAAEKFRSPENARQPRGRTKIIPEGWKGAARALMRHVVIQNPGADHSDVGALIQIIGQHINAVIADFDVGIEQADILSMAGHDSHVVAPGKSDIFFVLDQSHVREPGLHSFRRAVRRGIVHHDDFNTPRFGAI